MLKVYLAGGMKEAGRAWRAQVRERFHNRVTFLDPTDHELARPEDFVRWDLEAVGLADLVFCVIDAEQPYAYGAATEIGFALGRGKKVILVDLRSRSDTLFERQFRFVRTLCSPYDSLEDGMARLRAEVLLHRHVRR